VAENKQDKCITDITLLISGSAYSTYRYARHSVSRGPRLKKGGLSRMNGGGIRIYFSLISIQHMRTIALHIECDYSVEFGHTSMMLTIRYRRDGHWI
jgi:hypothetical protein